MGKIIEEMYNEIEQKYGTIALYRLIVRTRISRSEARAIEDSPENLVRIDKALKELHLTLDDVKKTVEEKKTRWWQKILRR